MNKWRNGLTPYNNIFRQWLGITSYKGVIAKGETSNIKHDNTQQYLYRQTHE